MPNPSQSDAVHDPLEDRRFMQRALVLAPRARARTLEISCPDGELEDARWFTPEELAAGTPALPPPQSISFRLISDWYRRLAGRELAEEPGARLWPRTR